MRKILFPILLVLCLSACKEDLTDYFDRMDIREHANDSLKKENNELEKQIEDFTYANHLLKLERDQYKELLDEIKEALNKE
jgi:cell division protein FtsB